VAANLWRAQDGVMSLFHGSIFLTLFVIWSLATAASEWRDTARAQKDAEREDKRRRERDEREKLRRQVAEAFKDSSPSASLP
jgi:hypothetical protein